MQAAQGGKSILIVDDDAVCRFFCEQALAGEDRRVLLAGTATEAINLARACRPALIILDLHLQAEPGQAVRTKILQYWPPAAALPSFVAMTGEDCRVRSPAPGLAGFYAVLPKFFTAQGLRALVDKVLAAQPAPASGSGTASIPASDKLERALRTEWCAGLDELDRHIAALDWNKAIGTLHRLCGAAALAGHPELARGARTLMDEMTPALFSPGMTGAYADFLWQGAGFAAAGPDGAAAFTRCESARPFP